MYEALIFDLDDTLYLESDFVASGYRAVARHVNKEYGVPLHPAFQAMMDTFMNSGRECVFPMVISKFLDDSVGLPELVEVYRNHKPQIWLMPGYRELLEQLRVHYRLGIITDGLPVVQKRKIEALELEHAVDKVIYTWEYGTEKAKPHPFSFLRMLEAINALPAHSVYVGDNPDKDCAGAHAAGMKFAMFRTPGRKINGLRSDVEKPDFVIDSLFRLPRVMETEG